MTIIRNEIVRANIKLLRWFLGQAMPIIAGWLLLLSLANAPTAHAAAILVTDMRPKALALTAEQTSWLKNKQVLRVATKPDWRPIDVTTAGGAYSGISGDYLRLLATQLGLRIEVTQYRDNDDAIAAVKAGKADVVPSVAQTPSRLQSLRFSRPYMDVQSAVFARTDTVAFELTGDWAGLRVAAERGFVNAPNTLTEKPRANLVQFADTDAALQALSRGDADIYLGTLPTTAASVEKLLLNNIVVRGYTDSLYRYLRFGVAPDDAQLVPILDAAIAAITFAQTEEIHSRWMPEQMAMSYSQDALPLSAEHRKWLLNNSSLRVAYDPEMVPITFTDSNGKMAGLAVDYLNIVTKKLGLSVKSERRDKWSEILAATKRGEVDILIASAMNQERLDYLDFAGPYLLAPTVIVDASTDNSVSEITQFIGLPLCVQSDHFLLPELKRRYPGIKLVDHPTVEKALQAVLKGDCHAAIGNLYAVAHLLETRFKGDLRVSGNVANGDSALYFATPKSKPELGQVLSIAKNTISQADRTAIRDKWLAVNYRPGFAPRKVAYFAIPIALGLLSTLAVFFVLNRKLRAEIRRRNALLLQLANKRMEAEAATQAKARFLAAMSHEIRTPMQGIVGAADMLSRAGLNPAQEKLNGLVQSAAQVIVQLLSEILDDRRLEEGHVMPRLAPEDLVERIRSAVQLFEPNAKQRKVRLSFEASPMVARRYMADGTYLRQIISNFISNAIKFSPDGAVQVQMDARALENHQHEITIAVIDTGRGMSAKDLENLFKPFVQGEAGRDADSVGSGLGLSICKRLADAMGAKLTVTSKPGLGTTMMLIIKLGLASSEPDPPNGAGAVFEGTSTMQGLRRVERVERVEGDVRVAPPETTNPNLAAAEQLADIESKNLLSQKIQAATAARGFDAAAESSPPTNINPATSREALPNGHLRILANEDDPMIRELMEDQFAALNVQADLCANAIIGLEAWRARNYDLIFTDNSLGTMTGAEFTAAVRAEEKATGRTPTPIVGITGSIMVEEHAECLRLGMQKILHKPIVLADLRAAINEFSHRKL